MSVKNMKYVCKDCPKIYTMREIMIDSIGEGATDFIIKSSFESYPNEQPCEATVVASKKSTDAKTEKRIVDESGLIDKLPDCKNGACYILDK